MSLKPLFRQNRCRHCFDKLNCDADISFGDCYIKGEKSRGGRSSVIVRTARGREAFNSIKSVVSCQSCTIEAIIQSQRADALNIEYSRAMEANANIYSNAPYTPDIKLDTEREEREYASLRIGAKAQCKQDYMDIYIAIGGDSPLERIKRFFNR